MSKKTDLLLRYESMLRGESGEWFDTEEYEEIALEYEMTSMLSDAIKAIETGLKYHPMSEELMTRRAYYLLITGRIEEAEEVISVVTDKTEEAQSIRAELCLMSGETDDAIAIIKDVLIDKTLQAEHILNIIDLCADYKLYENITPSIFVAIDRLPRTQKLSVLREFMKILEEESEFQWQIKVVEKILDIDPYSYIEWIKAIELYIYLSDIQKAFDAVEYAIAIEPSNTDAYYYKAYCFMEQADYDEAVSILESLDKTKDENIYIMLATCYTKMYKFDDSNRVLKESENYFPISAKSLYISAQNCYKSSNDSNKAIELLNKAEEIEPYSSDIVYMLAKLYYEQEAYEKAKDALTRLTYTDYDESDGKAYVIGGDIEIKCGSPEKALEYYKKAFALDKYDIDTCFKMIYTYSELHDVENMHNAIDYVEGLISNTNIETLSDEEQCRLLYLRSAVDKIKDILRNHIEDI